ncbi:MAG: hypothetical protein ACK53E_06235 [Pseudanabaena sp.]
MKKLPNGNLQISMRSLAIALDGADPDGSILAFRQRSGANMKI